MLKFQEYDNYKTFLASHRAVAEAAVSMSPQEKEDADKLLYEVKEDVERCVAKIMGNYKFFARFIYRFRIVYTYRISTMAVDEFQNLFINPRFAHELTDKQMMFVLCHEIIHVVLTHIPRGKVKGALPGDPEGWNYAADYETNALLIDEGLMTGDEVKQMGALFEEKYADMISEAIYDEKPPKGKEPKQMYPAEIGDFIKTKSGQYGQITAINADGSFRYKDVTEEDIRKAFASK